MEQKTFRQFNQVREEEVVQAWLVSKSKSEVKERLNVSNFGSKETLLDGIIQKYQLTPFHLKKVEDLSNSDIQKALKDPSVTTLKELCVKLGIAKKMHNRTLKARIISEKLTVKDPLHKAIFGYAEKPWFYPRRCFILHNQEIPTTCAQCGFEAIVPQQIQIHHCDSKEEEHSLAVKDPTASLVNNDPTASLVNKDPTASLA